jgi:hypothetical protein
MTFETLCVACGRSIEHGNFMHVGGTRSWVCKRPCWKLWKAMAFPLHQARPDWELVFGRVKLVAGERVRV